MNSLMMECCQFIKGLDPVADAFAGTVYSDVVNFKNLRRVLFLVYVGVGATGTSTFSVQACDDVVPTNRTAVPFKYREITTGDTEGAITTAAAAGFTCTAGSSKLILVEVEEFALADTGYGYVQLKAVESVNDPVLGGIAICAESKIAASVKPTAIV